MSYAGNCTTATDEALNARKSCVDGLGRMTGVWENPSGLNYETDYAYDALNDLTSVNQKGSNSASARTRTFQYDSLSRLTMAGNPESGTISYVYDANGNVNTKTAPLPNQFSGTVTTNYSYDVLSRLSGKSYVGLSTPAASYFYDQTSYNGLTISNGIGRRTGMSDGSGAAAWNYDSMGRVAAVRRKIKPITNTATYTHPPYLNGEVANLTYFSGSQVAYTWSAADRPLTAIDPYPINFVKSATYSPAGALAGAVFGAYGTGGFPGTTVSNSYNKRLQPTVLSASSPSMTVFSLSYNFNQGSPSAPKNNGSVVTIQNNRDNTRTQTFTYDALNRIASAQTPNSSLWGDTYVIDAWGNLTNKNMISGKGGENLQTSALTNNRLTGMTYDVAGNVINDGIGDAYVYDAENRLISAGGMSYIYDGDGNRVEKCTAGSTAGTCASGATGTLYWRGTSGETINESDLAAATWKRFVYFNGKIVARRDSSTGNVYYFYSDHLGSMGVVTDSLGGTIENESDYYPYGGERVIASSLSDEHYKFTGKERDAESGLDYFVNRHYANSLGRFMQPDEPFNDQEALDPQSWNLYSYVRNHPLTWVDPDGNAHSECSNDANGQQVCYIVGDKNGELVNNGTLQWNAGKKEWEKPEEHTYNDEERIEFIGNRVTDLTRFHSLWEVAENGVPYALGGYNAARVTLAQPNVITLGLNKSAAEALPKLGGLTKDAAKEALEKNGFKKAGMTKGGYEKWVHSDGSKVWIGPDGGIDKIPPGGGGWRVTPDGGP